MSVEQMRIERAKKIRLIQLFTISAFCVIGATLFYLQVKLGDLFQLKSKKNFTRLERIASLRGNIIDCNGNLLATNRPQITLSWHATGKRKLTEQQTQLYKALCATAPELTATQKDIERAERSGRSINLLHDIPIQQLGTILEQCPQNENIKISTTCKRYYPYHEMAAHSIGYLSLCDQQQPGKMGLEKMFDPELKGEPGTLQKIINARGKNLAKKPVKNAQHGQTIETTIDMNLQKIAEDVFDQEHAGSLIIMHPYDGSLRVLLSRPSFDPNILLNPISTDDWQNLTANNPFLNRGLNATYPPASIFKLVTATAALEEGLITQEQVWNCKGHIHFCKQRYGCNRSWGHGEVTIQEALAQSCNIPFYEIGTQIPIDTLTKYAHKFGLGERTGIIFPERSGLMPTNNWKVEKIGERWWQGETLSAVIGQSFLLVTPLQITRMVSAICEGHLVKPRFLLNEKPESIDLDISEETRLFLKDSMKNVITQGTGRKLKKLDNIIIYAKSGTAQVSSKAKRKLGKKHLEHAWFVVHAQYKDFDPIVMTILIEHAGTSRVASSIALKFLTRYCTYLDNTVEEPVLA